MQENAVQQILNVGANGTALLLSKVKFSVEVLMRSKH